MNVIFNLVLIKIPYPNNETKINKFKLSYQNKYFQN